VRVGFSGTAQSLEQAFSASATALGQSVATSDVADEATGRAQVAAGQLDVLVTGSATSPTAVVKKTVPPLVQAALERAVLAARLVAAGLTPADLASAMSGAQVTVDALQPTNPGLTQSLVVGLAVGILLWIALGLYGSQVAQGVVEEKASRIMEILLATVPPSQLLAGKIIGIGLTGLLQLGIVAVATLAAVAATSAVATPALSVMAVLGYLLWFLLGFTLYAAAYATLAALVSRPEEVQGAVAPINVFQIGAYLLAYVYLANQSNPLVLVASVLPPFSPILMAVRISSGDLPAWQVGLALVLIVASIAGLIWLAGRVYANSAMRIGSRVRFMDAFRG
jgi:ABC-2 type transport system permease protein